MIGEKMVIIPERDHYEVWVDGEFFCSADSVGEAEKEYEEWYDSLSRSTNGDAD